MEISSDEFRRNRHRVILCETMWQLCVCFLQGQRHSKLLPEAKISELSKQLAVIPSSEIEMKLPFFTTPFVRNSGQDLPKIHIRVQKNPRFSLSFQSISQEPEPIKREEKNPPTA